MSEFTTPELTLGLPSTITVGLFDLDGVLTDTASVHRAAWGVVFDDVLAKLHQQPFSEHEYEQFVDGKPRRDGVRDFLASRKIDMPEGRPDDKPDTDTVYGIATRKNEELLRRIRKDGVKVFDGSLRYLEAARQAGLHRYVVSSSANTRDVLEVTGLAALIEGEVDGNTIERRHLKGKPAPDSFLAGAELAHVAPGQAAVFEDATAGVEAGYRGRFGYVVGVNRHGDDHARELSAHGADMVVRDLADLL